MKIEAIFVATVCTLSFAIGVLVGTFVTDFNNRYVREIKELREFKSNIMEARERIDKESIFAEQLKGIEDLKIEVKP